MTPPIAPTTRAATVEFEHVTKTYADQRRGGTGPPAVHDLSFAVPAGRICVLVGPSGCGKTTSLKMVNRLIEPTAGRIALDGVDVASRDVGDLRRGIGYVIQQVGLFPHLTIGENVAVVPGLLGWESARRAARTDELLGLVGLDPAVYRGRYPSQLSGGERQRVGVARALAADPPVMLMDEPFGAVDPIVRNRLQNEFLRLQRELAKTILFVTHDIDEAIKMGDLVAILEATPQGGRLAQFGPPEEILAHPASDFVARFVGVDRGLKLLSLLRVHDLELVPAVTARAGDAPADARRRLAADPLGYLLLLDAADRPIGWLREDDLPADGAPLTATRAMALSPILEPETTIRDALSMLLEAAVQAGIVVDRGGAVVGLATIPAIMEHLRGASFGRSPARRHGETEAHP